MVGSSCGGVAAVLVAMLIRVRLIMMVVVIRTRVRMLVMLV